MMKKQVIVYIDAEIYSKLKELAEKKGASISQIVREIIYEVIRNGTSKGGSNS
jgi:Ribbon-helix-helix protein, copG family.